MTATHNTNCTASNAPGLYLALDLGASWWKLAFTVGLGQKPRLKTITVLRTLADFAVLGPASGFPDEPGVTILGDGQTIVDRVRRRDPGPARRAPGESQGREMSRGLIPHPNSI